MQKKEIDKEIDKENTASIARLILIRYDNIVDPSSQKMRVVNYPHNFYLPILTILIS